MTTPDARPPQSPPAGEHRDAIAAGAVRGRGAGLNPGNRFEGIRLHVLGEHLDEQAALAPEGRQVATAILADATRSVVNRVDSPDLPFSWSLNPYRGCEHGCIYCYARPTHEYLGMSCGLDFETKIVVKHDAPELLARFLDRPAWSGEPIVLSGVTDPYQPVEASLRITRRCLEVMLERQQPVSLITKNRLIERDLDLLAELARQNRARAAVSVTTLDPDLARVMEPRASAPRARLEAIRALASAGVPVSVMMAPIIPGLTDHEIPRVLEAAAKAGASGAGFVLLRLPHQIKALFLDWLARHFPDRAGKVEALVRASRGGALYDSAWGRRQRGEGEHARQIAATFEMFTRRYRLGTRWPALSSAPSRGSPLTPPLARPRAPGDTHQLGLFDAGEPNS